MTSKTASAILSDFAADEARRKFQKKKDGYGSYMGGSAKFSDRGASASQFSMGSKDTEERRRNAEEEAMRMENEKLEMSREEFMHWLSMTINKGKAFATMPFSILMVFSYISIIVTTDDPPSVNAVEDSIVMDIEENARFAWSLERGHKNVHDVNALIDFWSWMGQGMVPLIFGPGDFFPGPGPIVSTANESVNTGNESSEPVNTTDNNTDVNNTDDEPSGGPFTSDGPTTGPFPGPTLSTTTRAPTTTTALQETTTVLIDANSSNSSIDGNSSNSSVDNTTTNSSSSEPSSETSTATTTTAPSGSVEEEVPEEEVFEYPDWGDEFEQEVFPPAYLPPRMYTSGNRSLRGMYIHYNRIIGGVRLLQERHENDGNTEAGAGCSTEESLFPVYGMACWGGKGYEADPEVWDARLTPQALRRREEWLYLSDTTAQIHEKVYRMEAGEPPFSGPWLDPGTLKIEVALPIYNAEFGIHCLIHVNFFFSRGGHIWKDIIPLSVYAEWFDTWAKIVYDGLWCLCLVWLIASQVGEIYKVLRKKGCVGFVQTYFQFWNMIDWISVMTAAAVLIMFGYLVASTDELNKAGEELAAIDEFYNRTDYRKQLEVYIDNLESTVHFCNWFRKVMALYPLILIWRLLKAFSVQPRLAVVTRTIAVASVDLAHFGFLFLVIFSIYAMSGLLLFGRTLANFSQIWRVYYAIFLQMLGVFEWEDLRRVGRMEAGIWFWIFMILVSLIMLNMLIALVMDAYEEVKSRGSSEETLYMSCLQAWRHWRGVQRGQLVKLTTIRKRLKKHVRKLEREKNRFHMRQMMEGEVDPEKADHDDTGDHFAFRTIDVNKMLEIVPKLKRAQAVDLLEQAHASMQGARMVDAPTSSLQDQLNEIRISLELLLGNLKAWITEARFDPYDADVPRLSDITEQVRRKVDPLFKDVKKGFWWASENKPSMQQLFASSRGSLTASMLPMEVDIEDYETCTCGIDFKPDAFFCDACGRKRPEALPARVARLQAEVSSVRSKVGELLSQVSEQQRVVRHAQASRIALEDAEKRLLKRAKDLDRVNSELSTRLPYVIDPDLQELNVEREGGRPEILQQLVAEQRQLLKQLEERGISPTGIFAAAQAAVAARRGDNMKSISERGSEEDSVSVTPLEDPNDTTQTTTAASPSPGPSPPYTITVTSPEQASLVSPSNLAITPARGPPRQNGRRQEGSSSRSSRDEAYREQAPGPRRQNGRRQEGSSSRSRRDEAYREGDADKRPEKLRALLEKKQQEDSRRLE
eukprot:CAMPEP_0178410908 /NCGR_PEP_ID=MMETSP0689_2-20121128/21225_1 /TAXON_ID=160604 /ORGANISM="Amphidinium massartii, Strain CS-259" /LENGTH=1263 /DNA_ID=CAMNT_0020032105 /DNA_START=54 /DNA_END=3845 /DNA_ORIENTATION=+